jgi:hypothetical protein
MTLELNTKLENTVKRPAIPVTRKQDSNNWPYFIMLNHLQR